METKTILISIFSIWLIICTVMICINELQVLQLSIQVQDKLNSDFSGALQESIQYHQQALMWFLLFIIGYGGTRYAFNIKEDGIL